MRVRAEEAATPKGLIDYKYALIAEGVNDTLKKEGHDEFIPSLLVSETSEETFTSVKDEIKKLEVALKNLKIKGPECRIAVALAVAAAKEACKKLTPGVDAVCAVAADGLGDEFLKKC